MDNDPGKQPSETPGERPKKPADATPLADIVADACALDSTEREAFLTRACGTNTSLLARARALIKAHDEAESAGFLRQETVAGFGINAVNVELAPNTVISPYTIVRLIGSGGFGVVYEATQQTPIARRVALKLLRSDIISPNVLKRFDKERQALEMMEHPNIARVLDAGETADRTPYFVMEYVEGTSLTAFCDTARLGLRERVQLIVQTCRALQHAHSKGIVHRDVKPSNILASMQDGQPVVKIIDFGVAKALEHIDSARTTFTRSHQIIGTPEYMSPEQAGAEPDIDTRTDVYSLGVVLYEVLTGVTPFDAKRLRSAAYAELERVLREVEPPRPSTRLSSLSTEAQGKTTLTSIAAARCVEPTTLLRQLRSELDWIVLRCLEKDRARRYDTAASLGDDLERFVRGEAVIARPPSRAYRSAKFIKRYRLGISAALVALFSMIGATAWSIVQSAHARRAEKLAITERERAQLEADKARASAQFLEQTLAFADPAIGGQDMMVVDALERALALLNAGELRDSPEVEAASRRAIGASYIALGRFDIGVEQLQKAVDIAKQGPCSSTELARCLHERAIAARREDQIDKAEAMLHEAIAALGNNADRSAQEELQSCLASLSTIQFYVGKTAESASTFEQSRKLCRDLFGEQSPEYVNLVLLSANSLHTKQHDPQPLRDAIKIYESRYGPNHPMVATLQTTLASWLQFSGDLKGSIEAREAVIASLSQNYGEDHRYVASAMFDLGDTYRSYNATPEATAWLLRAKSIASKSRNTARTQGLLRSIEYALGSVAANANQWEEAVNHFRAAAELSKGLRETSSGFIRFGAKSLLADSLFELDKLDEAEAICREILSSKTENATDWPPVRAENTLGAVLTRRGQFAQAEQNLLASHERISAMFAFKGGPVRPRSAERLVALYEAWDKAEPGKGILAKAEPFRTQATQFRQTLRDREQDIARQVSELRTLRGDTLLPNTSPSAAQNPLK